MLSNKQRKASKNSDERYRNLPEEENKQRASICS